jgi:tetratricopeptide (TPR) repeat protein
LLFAVVDIGRVFVENRQGADHMVPVAIGFLSLVLLAEQTGVAVPGAVAELARGTTLAREGKYDLAIEHYKAALRLDPHLPGLQLNLGLAYFKSNHLREATAAFEEAVRADSASFQARALLGMSYYGSGRYREAAAQLKLASDAQPDNLELRYTMAQTYLWSEQYPEALREFQFLLSKDPDSAPVHILLGQALDASNRTKEATEEFEAAVKAVTVPPDAHFGLGYLYWKQRHYEDACREFEAELQTQPQHAQALAYLGDAEMRADRNKPAEAHLRRALALDANLRLAHLDLGIVLAARNDSDEAVRHYREAIRIDPSKPDAHYRLGRLLGSLGREHDAQDEFDKVQKLAAEETPPPLLRLSGRRLP